MTDTDNPFGTFAPQPAPMFTETDDTKGNKLIPPTEPSPQRKSRRSKRTAAAPGPTSSAEKPKRKYTRRTFPTSDKALAAAASVPVKPPKLDLTALAGLTEAEIGIIARLLEMPGIELVKIGKALQKLGAA